MKKDYLKPEMDVMEITTESMLATSGDKMPVDPEGEEGGNYSMSHRGEWGNIWGK